MDEDNYIKECAAIHMQYWWRNVLRKREAEEIKQIKRFDNYQLPPVDFLNPDLQAKLELIRREKAVQQLKYNALLRQDPRDVAQFLRDEARQEREFEEKRILLPTVETPTFDDQQKIEAVRKIEKWYSSHLLRRRASEYKQRIEKIPAKERIQLIERIVNQMGDKNVIHGKVELENIKTKLQRHKERRDEEALFFAKCMKLVTDYEKIIKVSSTRSTPKHYNSVTETIGREKHEKEMKRLEDIELGIGEIK